MRPYIQPRAAHPRAPADRAARPRAAYPRAPAGRAVHPRTGEGLAVLGVLTLLVVELVFLGLAPTPVRPLIGAALAGAGAAVFVVVAVVLQRRRSAARRDRPAAPPPPPDGRWYGADALTGFPAEELARRRPTTADPGQNCLQTAWVLATHGHDAAWIAHHLDIPADLARLLADTAARRAVAPDGTGRASRSPENPQG
ncbi:hypothetical protein ACFC1R_26965 [Kitasatospora sp. NPDC056138]|uniref:hypothetical protein n=1 Tax=Kitasatospora sp. NPDC056138 TaxID=3345724 RepID=UPI0035DDDE8F